MRASATITATTLLLIGLVGPMGTAAPAQAAVSALTDPSGDAGGAKRLDVTHVKVDNLDNKIVARVTFAKPTTGDLIVSIDPRGKWGLGLIATRKGNGEVTAQVLPGSFTDRDGAGAEEICQDLGVRWDQDVARLVMPARCLHDGNYGAVRFAVLTENGADSDYVPDTADGGIGVSGWIPRG